VTVIAVPALPAPSCDGENEQVAPAGSPEQVYVTGAVNEVEPTGETVMVVEVDCPAFAAAGAVKLAGTLTSVFTVRLTEWV
jgi:hypothetical protein